MQRKMHTPIVYVLASVDFTCCRYIDNPVDMGAAGLPPFGSNATGVCWPNYDFGGAFQNWMLPGFNHSETVMC